MGRTLPLATRSRARVAASAAIALMALIALSALGGCANLIPAPRGVDYPAPTTAATRPSPAQPAPPLREWRAAGAGLDAAYERSALLSDTFYRNADALLRQVERSGAMGVNRGRETGARKNSDWFIEEQRFADTVIGAGINRNRDDLIDAGMLALEWGFAQQSADGSFPCKDNYLGAAYFVAATAHSIWLLESTGYARNYAQRIEAIRARLQRAALWLADGNRSKASAAQYDRYTSRYLLTGYALGATARVTGNPALAAAGEDMMRTGLSKLHASGYFPESAGFDVSFQAEAMVYGLRYYDHAATAEMRREMEAPMRRALGWLQSRVGANGVVQTSGNTRSGSGKERDRTGQFRRVSAVAVSRAFGLAGAVLGDNKYEALARAVASARQAG